MAPECCGQPGETMENAVPSALAGAASLGRAPPGPTRLCWRSVASFGDSPAPRASLPGRPGACSATCCVSTTAGRELWMPWRISSRHGATPEARAGSLRQRRDSWPKRATVAGRLFWEPSWGSGTAHYRMARRRLPEPHVSWRILSARIVDRAMRLGTKEVGRTTGKQPFSLRGQDLACPMATG